jgi:ketosteroid isomerase-like protein
MKKNIITICLIAIAMIFSVGAVSQTIKASKKGDDLKAKVQAMNDKLAKANVAGDMDAVAELYAEDIIYMPNYAPMVKGKEAMMKQEEEMSKSGAKITSKTLTTMEVMDMGEMVLEVGTYVLSMDIPGMDQPWADKGKYVSLWRKTKGGGMEMAVDIWNTNVNPWEMMGGMEKPQGGPDKLKMEKDKK